MSTTPFLPNDGLLASLLRAAGIGAATDETFSTRPVSAHPAPEVMAFAPSRAAGASPSGRTVLRTPLEANRPPPGYVASSPSAVASAHLDSATEDALARGAVELRLNTYLTWLKSSMGALAAFVVDADGLVLANHNAHEDHMLATVAIGNAERILRSDATLRAEGNATIELDGSHILQLIRTETRVGQLGVGLMVSNPIDRTKSELVRRMLRKVVAWEQPLEPGRAP
jgi:hypothetical protein